jgi:hypothetical protein
MKAMQRETALKNANRIRVLRQQIKRELKEGERSLTEILLEDPVQKELETELIGKLLRAAPKIGNRRAESLVITAARSARHIRPVMLTKQLGELTLRQRKEIAGVIEGFEKRCGKRQH